MGSVHIETMKAKFSRSNSNDFIIFINVSQNKTSLKTNLKIYN